jgi:hypothetical protein
VFQQVITSPHQPIGHRQIGDTQILHLVTTHHNWFYSVFAQSKAFYNVLDISAGNTYLGDLGDPDLREKSLFDQILMSGFAHGGPTLLYIDQGGFSNGDRGGF